MDQDRAKDPIDLEVAKRGDDRVAKSLCLDTQTFATMVFVPELHEKRRIHSSMIHTPSTKFPSDGLGSC